jgi:hypothetical protein
MASYDHIHDDNIVPLFEDILIQRRDQRLAMGRLDGLKARLRRAFGMALGWRRVG